MFFFNKFISVVSLLPYPSLCCTFQPLAAFLLSYHIWSFVPLLFKYPFTLIISYQFLFIPTHMLFFFSKHTYKHQKLGCRYETEQVILLSFWNWVTIINLILSSYINILCKLVKFHLVYKFFTCSYQFICLWTFKLVIFHC